MVQQENYKRKSEHWNTALQYKLLSCEEIWNDTDGRNEQKYLNWEK